MILKFININIAKIKQNYVDPPFYLHEAPTYTVDTIRPI